MIDIKTISSSSKGNCYLISDGSTSLLLECGLSFTRIRKELDFNTSNITACLVTHEHGDHSKGLNGVLKAGIDTYMSQGTKEAIGIENHRIKTIKSMQTIQIGTWRVAAFDTEHDVAEPIGFLLVNEQGEKLLFTTDTYYVRYTFSGLTHVMIECNYSMEILNENIASGRVHNWMKKRLIKSHFSLENVKEFLKSNDLSKVQEIHLLHLSDTNSNEELFKREIQELTGKIVYTP